MDNYIILEEEDKNISNKLAESRKKILEEEKHELTRKRDILSSIALLDGLKSYIGEDITAIQIRNMKKEKLESYFLLYQKKAGQESANEMMSSLVEMSVKGLSLVVDIDDDEELKNDLINNKQLRRIVGRKATGIVEKYGDFVAIFKVLFTVVKHISFERFGKPSTASVEEMKTITDSASTPTDSASTPTDSASTMLAQC